MKTLIRIIATAIFIAEVALFVKVVLRNESGKVEVPSAPLVEVAPTLITFAEHCDSKPPADFDVLVQSAAFEFGVDPRVLATTVYRESDCDEKALGSSGEIGLGQVHPKVWSDTLIEAGIIRRTKDLWTPITNLRASAYILARLSDAADGDLRGTFRRYNGSGPKARKYAREQVQVFASLWP
jgi:soluble lytic murein transglycosylase-like protein